MVLIDLDPGMDIESNGPHRFGSWDGYRKQWSSSIWILGWMKTAVVHINLDPGVDEDSNGPHQFGS